MEYTTDFTDKDLLNSDGRQVEYFFEGIRKIGVLTVEKGLVYLCQNDLDGFPCQDKKGFYHSYILDLNDPSKRNYYKEIIQKLYKPKSLVGRYLKALVDNAQHTYYKKGEYVKITNDYNVNYQVSIGIFGANISEISIWELIPEGFEPNQNPTVLDVELVKGEYYVIKASYEWILKFDKIENGKIHDLWSINIDGRGRYYEKGCWCDDTSIRSISKANFSERLWLDKCIAAGKFIPKEEALKEKWIPKSREWVVLTTDLTEFNINKIVLGGCYYVSDDYKINSVAIEGVMNLCEYLRPALPHEIPEMKLNFMDSYGSEICLHGEEDNSFEKLNSNSKSDLEFQEPVIIKSIKNKPKLIIINN